MKRSPLPPRTTRLRRRGRPRYASYVADKPYQDWVRAHPCAVGMGCKGRVEFAHVTSRGAGGHDHGNGVPLCWLHHASSHLIGQESFARKHRVNLKSIAQQLWHTYSEGEL